MRDVSEVEHAPPSTSRMRKRERQWNHKHHQRRLAVIGLQLVMSLCLVRAFRQSLPVFKRPNFLSRRPLTPINANLDMTISPSDTASGKTRDVRFISPLLKYGYRSAVEEYENGTLVTKPLLLYLPGFDGTFLSPFLQFPELHTIFDVRCLCIGTDDRSSFDELSDTVLQYLETELFAETTTSLETMSINATESSSINATASTSSSASDSPSGNNFNIFFNLFSGVGSSRNEDRPIQKRSVYLAGESFGGILALDVARRIAIPSEDTRRDATQKQQSPSITLQGLTLINPATCFDRSRLAAQGPAVADLPAWLYPFGLLRLLPLFADEYSLPQLGLILTAKALPSVIDNAEREAYMGRVALSLPFVLPYMKQETLKWRLTEWLATGCNAVATQLEESAAKLNVPVLIVAGERDGTLPSISEAERLAGLLPDVSVHVVEGAGHASTCGSRVDLAALFRSRFRELTSRGFVWGRSSTGAERTAMKTIASNQTEAYFGMEPRYDNATIGLSPLRYWNKLYWKEANQSFLNIL